MSMRNVFRKVAKKHGVSIYEVRREMQEAIRYGYDHCPSDGVTRSYQMRVPRQGEVPTSEEFVQFAAKKIRTNL